MNRGPMHEPDSDCVELSANAESTTDTPAQQLARSLHRLRAQQRLSLTQLAHRSGISAATLCGLEAGRGNPTMATLLALARALAVPAGDLLPDTDPATGKTPMVRNSSA